MVWVIPLCSPVAELNRWLGTKTLSGVDRSAQTRQVHIKSPCIHLHTPPNPTCSRWYDHACLKADYKPDSPSPPPSQHKAGPVHTCTPKHFHARPWSLLKPLTFMKHCSRRYETETLSNRYQTVLTHSYAYLLFLVLLLLPPPYLPHMPCVTSTHA